MAYELVQCCDCKHFSADRIGDGLGIGNCGVYDEFKAKGPSVKSLESAFRRLGGKLFWGGRSDPDRVCEKFEGVNSGI